MAARSVERMPRAVGGEAVTDLLLADAVIRQPIAVLAMLGSRAVLYPAPHALERHLIKPQVEMRVERAYGAERIGVEAPVIDVEELTRWRSPWPGGNVDRAWR